MSRAIALFVCFLCACGDDGSTAGEDTPASQDAGGGASDGGLMGVDGGGGPDSAGGPDAARADTGMSPADTGSPDVAPGQDTGGGGTFDLTGSWAGRVINSQCFDGGLVGKDTVQITSMFLVQLTQSGTQVGTVTAACAVELTAFAGNQTTYPQAAVSALMTPPQSSVLSSTQIGATYTPAERVSLLGWRAAMGEDPRTAMVPEDPADMRVFDADNDGNPGVTLQVSGRLTGDIYIVNRNIVSIAGIVVSTDRIEGMSNTVQLQHILDSSNPLLGLSSIVATPNPDAASSTYLLVRLPPGVTSCAEIVAQKDTLFSVPGPITPCPP